MHIQAIKSNWEQLLESVGKFWKSNRRFTKATGELADAALHHNLAFTMKFTGFGEPPVN